MANQQHESILNNHEIITTTTTTIKIQYQKEKEKNSEANILSVLESMHVGTYTCMHGST